MIIFTLAPRFKVLLIVSALSCLGGSKRGMWPTNCHKPPKLSSLPSETSWYATTRVRNLLFANLSIIAWTLRSIFDLLCMRFRICSSAPLLTRCIFPWPSIYVRAIHSSVGLNGRKWTSWIPARAFLGSANIPTIKWRWCRRRRRRRRWVRQRWWRKFQS